MVERCGLAVALSGNGVTQSDVDRGEGYELLALGGDERHGGGTEVSFGLDDELFVVEGVGEAAEAVG